MDARLVIAAAEPLRTARLVPQCAVQRPALAAVLAAEQPAGDGACPQHSRLAGSAGLQRPEQVQAWRILLVRIHPGIRWRGNLGPAIAAVITPVQLTAEMATDPPGIKLSVTPIVQHLIGR